MKFLTLEEFKSMKVYALDDVTYRRIEQQFVTAVRNETLGKRILAKYLELTVAQLSAQNMVAVNVLDCITIL